jgi:glutamine synthetase
VQQLHAEGGGGQFELAMAHADALGAADALVLQREAVVDTAARRGRPASFLPKLWQDRSASGSHIHFSLWKVGHICKPGRTLTCAHGMLPAAVRHPHARYQLTASCGYRMM